MFYLSVFLSSNLYAQQVGVSQGCDDLFFSELTLSKDLNASSVFELNYAIEIYNSSITTINLSNYQLQLSSNISIITSIPLSGILYPYKCFVVSNNLAKSAIAIKSDMQDVNLDLGLNIKLDLVKNNVVIDQIGEGVINNNLGVFDYVAFMADPYAYLANIDVNLDEFNSINVRRSFFVKKGNPDFNTNNIIGNWAIYPSSDISNLGIFKNVCNAFAPGDEVTIGWQSAKEEFCIGDPLPIAPANCGGHDPMILNISIAGGGGGVWPTGGAVQVRYKPQYLQGGNLVNNCMFYTNPPAFVNNNAISLYPLLSANATLITQGNTTTQAPVIDYEQDPIINNTNCWIKAFLNTTATNILSSYFPYEYKFDLTNNVFLNTTAVAAGFTIVVDAASPIHTLWVKNNPEQCPKYNTSIKNVNIDNEFMLTQSGALLSLKAIKNEKFSVTIYAIDGAKLFQKTNLVNSVNMSTANYATGIYLLKIETAKGSTIKKISL